MVNTCSKSLHFGGKSWGEFEKPTPEVPILGTVCHLDSICGVFQQTLRKFRIPYLFETLREHGSDSSRAIELPNFRF
jgi:hypothetical protein